MTTPLICPAHPATFLRRYARLTVMLLGLLVTAQLTGAEEAGATEHAGKLTPPVPTHRVSPRHPPEMINQLTNGSALIECAVAADGTIASLKVVSATTPSFGQAALDALQQWTFEPGRRDGQPVPVTLRIPIEFILGNNQVVEHVLNRRVYEELPDQVIAAQELPAWPRPKQFLLPHYPNSLRGTGKYGKAVVSIVINKEGKVMNPRVVKATYPEFVLPALVAAAQLEFPPQVMANGERIYAKMDIQFDFESPKDKPKGNKASPKDKRGGKGKEGDQDKPEPEQE